MKWSMQSQGRTSLRIRLSGIEEEDISAGFVLSSIGKTFGGCQ